MMWTLVTKHRRRLATILGILLLLGAVFSYRAIRSLDDLFETRKASPTAVEYANWVGLWLPESVEDFQAYAEGWQDWLIEARFEMPEPDLTAFLANNSLQASKLETRPESAYKLEWFQTSAELSYYELRSEPEKANATKTGFYPSIWIAPLEGDRVIVFILAFDT